MWKLGHLCRRQIPVRANSLGMWKVCLKVIAWLAAGSNLYLFAFTSSQMRQWFPQYFVTDKLGNTMPKASALHEILLIVLILEHCAVITVMLVRNTIACTPETVRLGIMKNQWYHEDLASKARFRSVKRSSAEVASLSHIVQKSQHWRPSQLRQVQTRKIASQYKKYGEELMIHDKQGSDSQETRVESVLLLYEDDQRREQNYLADAQNESREWPATSSQLVGSFFLVGTTSPNS